FPGSRGFKDATTNLAQVRAWWTATPDANIGIPTGHGFDVIDIDPPDGPLSLLELRDAGLVPEVIGKVITPRYGDHLYVRASGDGNTAGLLPGIDYRGLGGYVVAPPSIGPNGVRYTWTRALDLAAVQAQAKAAGRDDVLHRRRQGVQAEEGAAAASGGGRPLRLARRPRRPVRRSCGAARARRWRGPG